MKGTYLRVIVFAAIVAVLGLGTYVLRLQPWLFDDYRAGYASAGDRTAAGGTVHARFCMIAVHRAYPELISADANPSDAHSRSHETAAFLLGCEQGVRGLAPDVLNVAALIRS